MERPEVERLKYQATRGRALRSVEASKLERFEVSKRPEVERSKYGATKGRAVQFFGRCFRMMGVSWCSRAKKDMGSSMSIS